MRSNQTHQFSQVPKAEIPRSVLDRSHGYKTTFDAGYLVPVYVDEVLPGDTFHLKMHCFGRMATPLHPIMDNLFLDSFFFFVPLRIIWNNFQKFMGEQTNPGDSTSFVTPKITAPAGTGWVVRSLADYFGLPCNLLGVTTNSFHFRAYNLIWNQWFRDQNLQNSLTVDLGDGPDLAANYSTPQKRGKRHDYFTSALPWPQKGPAVQLPLGTTATIRTNTTNLVTGVQNPMTLLRSDTGAFGAAGASLTAGGGGGTFSQGPVVGGTVSGMYPANLYADLTTATAATINQLRQAFQIQKIYERDARGGTRYTELIQAHFGVTSPDARLQRAEYLGGGSTTININPIAQTSSTASQPTPQGNLAAMGTLSVNGHGFSKSFTEHGVLIGMVSVRADMNYQDGIERMWSRDTRFDYYWPALSHIGEQAILNKEIWATGSGNPAQDIAVFGYQERYGEYRYKPSVVTGLFRSNAVGTLDSWHLAQKFAALPVLNATFIQENPPVSRVIAVPSEQQFLLDCYFQLKCARPMPVYGVPGKIDHF